VNSNFGRKWVKSKPCHAASQGMRCGNTYGGRDRDPPLCAHHLKLYKTGKTIEGYDGKVYEKG